MWRIPFKKGKDIAVLPYMDAGAASASGDPWLLKMHGCVTHPEDIVLTRYFNYDWNAMGHCIYINMMWREDYIRYHERRQALAGIVQAFLITKHMLFIGTF